MSSGSDPDSSSSGAGSAPERAGSRPLEELTTRDLVSALAPLRPGSVFAGRYRIEKELGRGGFGIVYRAFDTSPLQRLVALKLISFPRSTEPGLAIMRHRFLEEARLAGSLSHANVAAVHDVGEADGAIYMTQELAPGHDLRHIIAGNRQLPLRRVLMIARRICAGLAHAHSRGIVHRDVKPANAIIDGEDGVKITDFGLAHTMRPDDSSFIGHVAGTPGYMAPEQLRGERVDSRADIFAVGCVIYEMLAGRAPFQGETLASIVEKTLHAAPPGPSRIREDLPRTLDRIVARAMRKDPAERYQEIGGLAQDLEHYDQFERLSDSETAVRDLRGPLQRGECVLFLGLHLPVESGSAGIRTAHQVISENLAGSLGRAPDSQSLPRLAQEVELEHGREALMRQIVALAGQPRVSPREVIRKAARLPFAVIVTTGYDTFLEEELGRAGRKVRRIVDCRKETGVETEHTGGLLIKLFGSIEDAASILITEDDLWDFFGAFQTLPDSLKSHFATRPLLFVGYDPLEESFRRLFMELARLWSGGASTCLLPVTDVSLPALRWAEKRGLRLVDADPGAFLGILEEALVEERRDPVGQVEAEKPPLPGRPWKFLNYYEASDEAIFFGRESETQKLLNKVQTYPLNLLYAPSGSGKTSLIQAGLTPRLQREGWTVLYCRVYDDPEGEIRARALDTCAPGAPENHAESALPDLLSQVAARSGGRLLVVIDQFEEIFIRFKPELRDRFAATLQECLSRGKGRVRFLLSLREDFLARLSEFRPRIPNIFHNELRLGPLTAEQTRTVIVAPAALLGIEVEPALVDRLLVDLESEGVEPPQLQMVCDALYDGLDPGEKRLTLRAYADLGETRKILAGYLERVLNELAPTDREAARSILKNLITSEQTKSVSRLTDLSRAASRPEEEIARILQELLDRRLVRRVHHEEGLWYELTHEYLVEEIGRWLSEKERELKRVRDLMEQALRNHHHLGLLMPAAQVKLVRLHEVDLNLSREEKDVLKRSELAFGKRRRVAILSAAAGVVLLALGGIGWRFAYLRSHVFVKAEDRESFIEDWTGSNSRRLERLWIHSGSPRGNWLDARLGFPKALYQTDFVLTQVESQYRDRLKAGMSFSSDIKIEEKLAEMLKREHRIRLLVMQGQEREALQQLPGIYENRPADPELAELGLFLAASDIRDSSFLDRAIPESLVWRGKRIPGGFLSSGENSTTLSLLPDEPTSRVRVLSLLKISTKPGPILEVLGGLGNPGDNSVIIPYLYSADTEVVSASLAALNSLRDCSALARIRSLLDSGALPGNLGAVRYLGRCGSTQDLERLVSAAAGADNQVISSAGRAAHRIGGSEGFGYVFERTTPRLWDILLVALAWDQNLAPFVRRTVSHAGYRTKASINGWLARAGDTANMLSAARLGADSQGDRMERSESFAMLRGFTGTGLRQFLLALAVSTDRVARIGALYALRWHDDAEVVAQLVISLKDASAEVRGAAASSLILMRSERATESLRAAVEGADSLHAVYAAGVIQDLGGDPQEQVFRQFIEMNENEATDLAAIMDTADWLRASYLRQPVASGVSGLESSHSTVRLAATLALAEHADESTVVAVLERMIEQGDWKLREAAYRVRWARRLVLWWKAILDQIESHIRGDDFETGLRIAQRHNANGDFTRWRLLDSLESLSPSFAGLAASVFTCLEAKEYKIQAGLAMRNGEYGSAVLNVAAYVRDPKTAAEIRADPLFKPLHTFYWFRIVTGMEPPKVVDGITFPSVAAQTAGK